MGSNLGKGRLSKSKNLLVTPSQHRGASPASGYTYQESVQTALQAEFQISVCVVGLEMLTQSHCLSTTRHSVCVQVIEAHSPLCACARGSMGILIFRKDNKFSKGTLTELRLSFVGSQIQ